MPYKNIVDQHFPTLFYGFFSLPFWLVSSPQKLLFLLFTLVTATSIFLYLSLKQQKVKNKSAWLVLYSFISFYFSANTLWVESFLVALTALVLYLNTLPGKKLPYISGIAVSLALLMRPTSAFFWLVLFLFFLKGKAKIFISISLGIFLSFLYLYQNSLLVDFYQNVFVFNREVYSTVQSYIPGARQVLTAIFAIFIFIYYLAKKQNKNLILLGLSSLLLLYPRFGLEHFQLFGLVFVYALAVSKVKLNFPIIAIVLVMSAQSLGSLLKVRYGNYFYKDNLTSAVTLVETIPEKEVYLFGASDLIYQLGGKVPPEKTYFPSLPWYLNYNKYNHQLLNILKKTNSAVIVDTNFAVDGVKLIDSVPSVYQYIKMNYKLQKTVNGLEVYQKQI